MNPFQSSTRISNGSTVTRPSFLPERCACTLLPGEEIEQIGDRPPLEQAEQTKPLDAEGADGRLVLVKETDEAVFFWKWEAVPGRAYIPRATG